MDNTTLLILIIVVLLVFGGGWYRPWSVVLIRRDGHSASSIRRRLSLSLNSPCDSLSFSQ